MPALRPGQSVVSDTAANWTATNPILPKGIIGVETDTGRGKVGSGTVRWNTLSYGIGNPAIGCMSVAVLVEAGTLSVPLNEAFSNYYQVADGSLVQLEAQSITAENGTYVYSNITDRLTKTSLDLSNALIYDYLSASFWTPYYGGTSHSIIPLSCDTVDGMHADQIIAAASPTIVDCLNDSQLLYDHYEELQGGAVIELVFSKTYPIPSVIDGVTLDTNMKIMLTANGWIDGIYNYEYNDEANGYVLMRIREFGSNYSGIVTVVRGTVYGGKQIYVSTGGIA